jgi:hypothetical protein
MTPQQFFDEAYRLWHSLNHAGYQVSVIYARYPSSFYSHRNDPRWVQLNRLVGKAERRMYRRLQKTR